MSNQTQECIEEYIKTNYKGGLIGISKLTELCNQPAWEIYSILKKLESQEKLKIITRYFCPEIHRIPDEKVPFCPECDLKYADSDIITVVYIEPI
ncbi:MAG: hypothetical protein KI793_28875 [Rivularia sp. (in: Bacteria)]|nr:hypothetical protein [Rivularia sp. MS3]